MAKSEQQKGKLLVLKNLLERKSDCDHPLSMQDILSHLESQGIAAERKSIYSDLETLREQGMDILYRQGRGGGYYLAARDFELGRAAAAGGLSGPIPKSWASFCAAS